MRASEFFEETFSHIASENQKEDPLQVILCEENIEMCRRFDLSKLQEGWSWRNVHCARELASLLLNEKGELKKEECKRALHILHNNLYSLGPDRHHDADRMKHLVKMVHFFAHDKEYEAALKKITYPEGHVGVQYLLRETLHLPENTPLTNKLTRQAVLSALFTSLRQNVGSCFATAPAIMIQQEMPLQFLEDIQHIIATGRFKRTFEGIEYAFPLSPSWGAGELLRPFPLSSLGKQPIEALALSPGLQAAFRAAGLKESCETLLKKSGFEKDSLTQFVNISAHSLIRQVLLQAYQLTEEDLQKQQDQPLSHMPPNLLLITAAPLGKPRSIESFSKAYERAKRAFKALTDNPLLKAWEFTLASLSEAKADFTKWNLYMSLGVQVEEPHGIGEALFQIIQQEIDEVNDEIREYESRYDHLYAQAKSLEGRLMRPSVDKEFEWIRLEYQMRKRELDRTISERDQAVDKGRALQQLYSLMIQFYREKIPDYFQEIYDPEMHEISMSAYDDSPAGFRLLYKHGRSNPSLWTLIYSATDYIQALASFFIATEGELAQKPIAEGLERELTRLITAAITTIKRPDFLESSFQRLAKAYHEPLIHKPLDHLEKVSRKPWAYISGGTVKTLINCYWGNPKIREEKKWVESPTELLAFFIDMMKEQSSEQRQKFQKESERTVLAFSPTHAFLCRPGEKLFRKAWEDPLYTYTWIRDEWLVPQQKFLDGILLDQWMMEWMVEKLLELVPQGYRQVIKRGVDLPLFLHPVEFREKILKALSYEKWIDKGGLRFIADELDSLLYESLPFFPEQALGEKLEMIFSTMSDMTPSLYERIRQLAEERRGELEKHRLFSSQELRNIAKSYLMLALGNTRSKVFFHERIVERMRERGLAMPAPLIFADTNWVRYRFGFALNPGTGRLDLWRLDSSGVEGKPMSIWRSYFDGTLQQEWGILRMN